MRTTTIALALLVVAVMTGQVDGSRSARPAARVTAHTPEVTMPAWAPGGVEWLLLIR
jgi:hypothetical protein